MIKIRCLSLWFMLFTVNAISWGQDEFNPESPSEPGAPPTKLVLLAEPANGGFLSGSGIYSPGTQVRVRAHTNSNFQFVCWTDLNGKSLSSSTEYYLTKGYATDTLIAHFEYTPNNPTEPTPGTSLVYYPLTVKAGNGGSVSGGGRYRSGSTVRLQAYPDQNFEFVNWTNEKGMILSTTQQFNYTTNAFSETITANFHYNPGSPEEPSDPILRHKIYVECTEGGTAYANNNIVLCGSSAYLSANVNPGYVFLGWYLNGTLYTDELSFTYIMGTEDVRFEARFEFNPTNPSEPDKPSDKQYAFYLMSEITFPGNTVECPLYLTILEPLGDMTFQLTFPEEIKPDWSTLTLGQHAADYQISITETETSGVYKLALSGSTIPAGNNCLLTVMVHVAETAATGTSYQVKINQVSVTEKNGTTVTASTRNGRVYIYQLGDTNGDGNVDILDRVNMANYILTEHVEEGTFIKEVSDVNGDGSYDIMDSVGVGEIILNDE